MPTLNRGREPEPARRRRRAPLPADGTGDAIDRRSGRRASGHLRRHGGVTFVSAQPSPSRQVVRHREHTLGVNRFAARLALDARAAGWRLAEWRNEAESTHRFVAEDGRIAWIRPDASGVLARGGDARPFLLEYDRGTLDSGDYRAKFEGYRGYAAAEWEDHFPEARGSSSARPPRGSPRQASCERAGQAYVLVTTEMANRVTGTTHVCLVGAEGGRTRAAQAIAGAGHQPDAANRDGRPGDRSARRTRHPEVPNVAVHGRSRDGAGA